MINKHISRCLRLIATMLIGILLFSHVAAVHAGDSETLKRRFIEEAPHAWEEYQSYVERLQGSSQTTVTINNKIHSRMHVEYKKNQHCAMVLSQSLLEGNESGEVFAFNPLYGFELKRKAKKDGWILGDLRLGKTRVGPKDWEKFPAMRVCISTQLYELLELVRLPNFQVASINIVNRYGHDVFHIFFISDDVKGDLIIDSNRFWTLKESNIRNTTSDGVIVVKQVVEVRDPAAKYPIPKHWLLIKEVSDSKNGTSEARVMREFNLKEVDSPPDDNEFTLSAFGLPEPMGVAPLPQSHTWLWLLTATVAAVALAILFAWLKRRRTRTIARSSNAS